MLWHHGTTKEAAQAIEESGFDLDLAGRRDPGDFGLGVYATHVMPRAQAYGRAVVTMRLDGNFANIQNPYFVHRLQEIEPQTDAERLFHGIAFDGNDMITVRGKKEDRLAAAGRVREAFLGVGYDGIIASQTNDAVIFNTAAIQLVGVFYSTRH